MAEQEPALFVGMDYRMYAGVAKYVSFDVFAFFFHFFSVCLGYPISYLDWLRVVQLSHTRVLLNIIVQIAVHYLNTFAFCNNRKFLRWQSHFHIGFTVVCLRNTKQPYFRSFTAANKMQKKRTLFFLNGYELKN